MSRYLSPSNDIAFKKIFGEVKNKDILIHFLNDVLGKDGYDAIADVIINDPVQQPEIAGAKQSILDILCTDNKGTRYIVEMQVAPHRGFEKRAQYYAAKVYSGQAKIGDRYYELKEVIFLAILDFEKFPKKTAYKSSHVILDKETYEHDLKDFSFTFIELPKFTKTNPEDLLTYEEKWCYFFKHASEPDNMRWFFSTIKDENEVIHRAYNILEAHNWTEEELALYDKMEKINMDIRAREDYIIEKVENAEKALNQAKEENARVVEENARVVEERDVAKKAAAEAEKIAAEAERAAAEAEMALRKAEAEKYAVEKAVAAAITKSMAESREDSQISIALNLKKSGKMSDEDISSATGLLLSVVKELN